MLLAGDIGGTKTDLAVYSSETGLEAPLAETEVHSADYDSLQAIAREFLTKVKLPVDRACFAVAGPVIGGSAKITNLPWAIDESTVAKELNLEHVHLMNDLEAIAFAIPNLRTNDLDTINAGAPIPGGAIGVIAPGTGLGESFLTWDGSRYIAHSSEGGHASFAPTDEKQIGLLAFMLTHFDHVSYEKVCSGIGIPHIYEYLRSSGYAPETPGGCPRHCRFTRPDTGYHQLSDSILPGPALSAPPRSIFFFRFSAMKPATLHSRCWRPAVFTSLVASLDMSCRHSRSNASCKRSHGKGRFAELMARIPIHVIVTRAALAGAASYGLENLV